MPGLPDQHPMPCVGFILRPQKRPRVLTETLLAETRSRGIHLLALDPCSTPDDWEAAGVTVLVHKAPDEAGLDARLESWTSTREPDARRVVLDHPTAVAKLQNRGQMLSALAGTPLMLKSPHQDGSCCESSASKVQQVVISIPQQVVLQPGCSLQQCMEQLAAAGLQPPMLVKPLLTMPGSDASLLPTAGARATTEHAKRTQDGHALGVVWQVQGLQDLLTATVLPEDTRQLPAGQNSTTASCCKTQGPTPCSHISLPVVVQQYVPHDALYKLYVLGPSCVLTRRDTITVQALEAAAASAPAGKQGIVMLPRLSALRRAAAEPAHCQQQHLLTRSAQESLDQHQAQPHGSSGTTASQAQQKQDLHCDPQLMYQGEHGCNHELRVVKGPLHNEGAVLMDSSVAGDPCAPPLWATQQLSTHLRQQLGMQLFNVDIINACAMYPSPSSRGFASQFHTHTADCSGECSVHSSPEVAAEEAMHQREVQQRFMVVDINYFPGYDKVPGAEALFADFLASCTGAI